jgi:FKBP-type peptidyl-prolyl cis-trans isomerase
MLKAYLKTFLIGIVLSMQCLGFPSHRCMQQSSYLCLNDKNVQYSEPMFMNEKSFSVNEKRSAFESERVSSMNENRIALNKRIMRTIRTVSVTMLTSLFLMSEMNVLPASAASTAIPQMKLTKGFQTKTGLKYFDIEEGVTGERPRDGQLVSFYYTGYYRATPDSKLDAFDSTFSKASRNSFLHKHGNGRIIRGIDEGLHTMKVGGKRRVIIPKNIGYERFGMGPVPTEPADRRKLGKLLDLLEVDKGELIFDLELVMVADDENDQGEG